MRVVGEIPHAYCKISLLQWNNRYLIKIEQGLLEQTFKINQFDLLQEADLVKLIDATFVDECVRRFELMHASLQAAMGRLESN